MTPERQPSATTFTATELTAALALYGLGPVQRFSLASEGIENANYFVRIIEDSESEGRIRWTEYVLTVLQQASNTSADNFVSLLQQSAAAGLPVPRLLVGSNGQVHQSFGGYQLLLADRLRGQHLVNPGLDQIAAIGRFFARWHLATAPLANQSQPFPRDAHWLRSTWNEVEASLDYTERSLLGDAVDACCASLARHDVAQLPQGFIHGDCFRDNVLFNGQALSGVLDFHHASRGTWLFDLAVIANDWCGGSNDGSNPDANKSIMLLRAYHHIRPLQPQEFWWFSTYCLYAATAFCLSRLQGKVSGQERLKDYTELLPKIRQHLYQPLHLDPRLLRHVS